MSPALLGNRLFFDFRPWLIAIFAVILVSVACWLPLIRGMTQSISQMTRATEQIAEGQFDVQVTTRRRDEIGQLGAAINRMASRLSGFVTGQKRFLGDIAHELCSPIARIQLALGILDQRAEEKQRGCVADLNEEVQYMSVLVNELLSFSKAGMQPAAAELVPVNVGAIVERVLEREADPEVRIETAVDEHLEALADPDYLFRALSNLVRNAVRYAGQAGPITVSSRAENGAAVIAVSDCGPGLAEDALEQVFVPFYRPEASRSRDTGGAGLGLAIVRTCIESCKGSVTCRNRRPSGLEVEIRLKAAG
jgi:two-component system sensor histidine kinase CpxA